MQQMKDFCPAQYYVQLFFLTKPKREKLSLILLDQVFTQLFSWNAMTDVTKVELVKLLLSFKDIVVTYHKNNKVVTKIIQPNISFTSYFKLMLSFEPWY